jgi:uncharacterized membrane protein YedE/YeeE
MKTRQGTKKTPRPYWWRTFISGLIAAVVMGLVGAGISRFLGAPYYFGGAIGFCIAGLAGLFALADRIAKKQ